MSRQRIIPRALLGVVLLLGPVALWGQGTPGAYMSGLVSVSSSVPACTEGMSLNGCTPRTFISINLVQGQNVTLGLNPLNDTNPNDAALIVVNKVVTSGTNYSVSIKVQKADTIQTITVSPTNPLYNTNRDPICFANPAACPINLLVKLLSDSQLTLRTDDGQQVSIVTTTAIGAILTAVVTYPNTSQATLTVVIWNGGDYKGNLVTTVECTAGIAPVAAQSKTLAPYESSTLIFKLGPSGTASSGDTCVVTLFSEDALVMDKVSVSVKPLMRVWH